MIIIHSFVHVNQIHEPMNCVAVEMITNTELLCQRASGINFTHNSSGNTQPQLFQLAEPLWTDPGPKSGTGVHDLISS